MNLAGLLFWFGSVVKLNRRRLQEQLNPPAGRGEAEARGFGEGLRGRVRSLGRYGCGLLGIRGGSILGGCFDHSGNPPCTSTELLRSLCWAFMQCLRLSVRIGIRTITARRSLASHPHAVRTLAKATKPALVRLKRDAVTRNRTQVYSD